MFDVISTYIVVYYEPFFTTLRTICKLVYFSVPTLTHTDSRPRVRSCKKYDSYFILYRKCYGPMKILSGGLKSFPWKYPTLFELVLVHVLLKNVLIIVFSLYSTQYDSSIRMSHHSALVWSALTNQRWALINVEIE